MAKVEFAPDIQSISGKLNKKNGTTYSVIKQTGETYRSMHKTFTDKNSAEQQVVRTAFKSKAKAASVWWRANKPTNTNPDGTADYQALIARFKTQYKIGNPYSYLRSLVADDLTITIIEPADTTETPTTPGTSDSSNNEEDRGV